MGSARRDSGAWLAVILLLGCADNGGLWTERYDGGQTKAEYHYYTDPESDRRIRHGSYTSYSRGGRLLTAGSYHQGQQEGAWTWYFATGQVEEEGVFAGGVKQGRRVRYYENGQIRQEGTYLNGKETGDWVTYYENGQVEEQATYRDGRRDGTVLEFYPDGRKRYEATFSGGKLEAPEIRHGEEALKHPHSLSRTAPAHFVVEFQTSAGDFSVSVDRALAPLGADRFYSLVSAGFYDQCRFFRVIPDFMAQFGYHGDPAVTAAWLEATIANDPVRQSSTRGTLSFAADGPDTRTTQVFISLMDNSNLDAQGFASFGSVTTGMDVVDSLFGGYGNGPSQKRISREGNAYLEANFPELDYIFSARVR